MKSGADKCLEYVAGVAATLFFKLVLSSILKGFLRTWVDILIGIGNTTVIIVGPVVEHNLFKDVSYDSWPQNFWNMVVKANSRPRFL